MSKIITLSDWSSSFPIKASWRSGGIKSYSVFANMKEVECYFIGRFGDVVFRDRRKKK